MSNVEKWLKEIHLEQYYSVLINNGFTSLGACTNLNDNILNRLGIDLPGHRKRILTHLPNEYGCSDDVEYGNITIPVPTGPPASVNPGPCDLPPPNNQCVGDFKSVKYLSMDRNSKAEQVSTCDKDDDDDNDFENVYDIPPPTTRPGGSNNATHSSDENEYVPPDPVPLLPPKRTSREDINAKFGITTPTPEDCKFSNTSKSVGPPLLKPIRSLKNAGQMSRSFDTASGSLRERPVPKPRASLMNKKPVPIPRDRKLVQSESEPFLNVTDEVVNESRTDTSSELEKTTSSELEKTQSDTMQDCHTVQADFNQTSENEVKSPLENQVENHSQISMKSVSQVAKHDSVSEVSEYELNDTDPTSMVDNSLYEQKSEINESQVTEYELNITDRTSMVDNSLYEKKGEINEMQHKSIVSEDGCHGEYQGKGTKEKKSDDNNVGQLKPIVVGAELSKEESENRANEMLYQETKVPRLRVDTDDERVSYAGLWDMRSGSERGDKIPVNQVKPFMRPAPGHTVADRSSFNVPAPSFSPPPLPKGFHGPGSPSIQILPESPELPPVVPPRGQPVVTSQNPASCKKNIKNGSDHTPASSMSESVENRQKYPPPSKTMSYEEEENAIYEMQPSEDLDEECPVYNTCGAGISREVPPAKQQEEAAVTRTGSVTKKPPIPPPKVDNPFKDLYDPYRGTYCLEGSSTDFAHHKEGWESEDTLSDGGDFLDEEETELPVDVRRSTLQRTSSIPIVSVTQDFKFCRQDFKFCQNNLKSLITNEVIGFGKSEGNTITGSYKAINRWLKRWVVFDSINLIYYATNKSQISNRIIPASSIINVEQDVRQGETHAFQFTVRTVDRAYTFAAEDANDLSLWCSLIMSALLEQQFDELQEGGDMHHPNKEGFVKMEGAKGKRYIAVKGDKSCYYNTYNDFKAGSPIHVLDMKLASVKDIGKNKLQMHTPYAPYVLVFESSDDLMSWKGALEEAIAEGLGDNSVLADVVENHSNKFCADCGSPDPHWASVNLGITLCKWCAGIHRHLSIPTSKVRSLRMDFKIWTPALRQVFIKIGNDEANNFWEWNAIGINKIDSDVDMIVRTDYITTKYKTKKFVRYHPLREDKKALNEALCKSVQYEDVVETMQLLFSGADILHTSDHYNLQTPLQIAKAANQTIQMEFLYQNGAEGSGQLPIIYSPTSVDPPATPVRTSITLKGHLLKTGSNVKREFLKRWVILEHEILSYYESESKSQAKDSIMKEEMLSVAFAADERVEFAFELATLKDRGRVYLFAADSEALRTEWISALSRTIAPVPEDQWSVINGISRGGIVFVKHGSSAKYRRAWMQVTNKTIKIFNVDKNEFTEIDLRRIKSKMMLKEMSESCADVVEKGNPFVLHLPNEAFYIQADLKKETEEWFKLISKLSEGGGTLSDQLLTRDNIPVIVDKCISYVELHGLMVEGIYRLSGQHSKVSKLLSDFSKDARGVHLSDEDYQIHDISTTLKRFFRNLEDPLMTKELYPRWIKTASIHDSDTKLQHYVQLLEELPKLNRTTLEKVMRHLFKVSENEPENKMSIINIASIFGPIMLNTTQIQETQAQGFACTNQEIAVAKDLLENQQFYFQMNTVDRQMEKKILEAMKKMEEARNVAVPSVANEMLLSIHVRNKDDPEVVTHTVSPAMTAQEVLSYVMKKRKLKSSDNWGLYEIICNEEMQRPLHFTEKVLDATMKWSRWPSEFCKDNHLCVKKNFVYDQIDIVYDSNFSLFGELRCSEKKQFKKFAFEFSQFKLSYHKRDARPMTQIGSWNVEDLIIYVGTQHERRPPTRWTFTFIQQGQDIVKSRDCPFFGHTVCCNNQEELYRWIAAMLRAQHPQGLQPGAESGASSDTTSQIELNTPVPPGGVNPFSGDRQTQRGEKSKSTFFQKLLNKNNR